MKVLRARLYEMEMQKQQDAIAKERRGQVGTGERSEKIRTYNFPQSRITDHRINFTTHRLHDVLEGELREIIDQVTCVLQRREAEGGHDLGRERRRDETLTLHERLAGGTRAAGARRASIRPKRRSTSTSTRAPSSSWDRARHPARSATSAVPDGARAAVLRVDRPARAPRADRIHRRRAGVLGTGFRRHARGADSAPRNRAHRRGSGRARRRARRGRPPRIADIGTGSGCIAVAVAHRAARLLQCVATDISREALAVAQRQRRRVMASPIGSSFVCTSYLDGVDGAVRPDHRQSALRAGTIDKPASRRMCRHEPDVALFGGDNGLRAHRRRARDDRACSSSRADG